MTKLIFEAFDAQTVDLKGSNLIEASAGTGKTYSIAILVLRMLLESAIPIREILMVTFTKAAVAELETRIRSFVRLALKATENAGTIDSDVDPAILEVVARARGSQGEIAVVNSLRDAMLYLDELSIFTIHGFCQQTLAEFPVETRQLFKAELATDAGHFLDLELQRFWRKHITRLDSELLELLVEHGFTINSMKAIVRMHLDGKHFLFYEQDRLYELDLDTQKRIRQELRQRAEDRHSAMEIFESYIQSNRALLEDICAKNRYARVAMLPVLDNSHKLLELVIAKKGLKYVQQLFAELLELAEAVEQVDLAMKEWRLQVKNILLCFAIQEAEKGISDQKKLHNVLFFDDLINRLHHAVHDPLCSALLPALRRKYRAVFIDEFQDTDKLQYEIFHSVFAGRSILFYIGDPKQSIYAWRKADIATYFTARESVDRLYTMNVNHRAQPELVQALNRFFLPYPEFDTFHFGDDLRRIDYFPVEAGSTSGRLWRGGTPAPPLPVCIGRNKAVVSHAVVAQVATLVSSGNYMIEKAGEKRAVRPSDIAILVRNKNDGTEIKQMLSAVGIPAVTQFSDARIFESAEALEVLFLLHAFESPSRSTINRVLLGIFVGYDPDQLLKTDEEQLMQRFRKYGKQWHTEGIYATLRAFVADFGVRERLLDGGLDHGQRSMTNLYQLMELLYQAAYRKRLSPAELIHWMLQCIDDDNAMEDEWIQRIESDEDAVIITTIHASKGLAYPIVIAPTLDFKDNTRRTLVSFWDEDATRYVTAERDYLSPRQMAAYSQQFERENRRLLYVALTRARYACFIYRSTRAGATTLSYFLDAIKQPEFEEPKTLPAGYRYENPPAIQGERLPPPEVNFRLRDRNWMRLSYSALSAEPLISLSDAKKVPASEDPYERFIFHLLPKGVRTGNLIHALLEKVDFSRPAQWDRVIRRILQRFVPERMADWETPVLQMLHHVMQAQIRHPQGDFSLGSVTSDSCVHELEFDFTVHRFTPFELNVPSEISVKDVFRFPVEGMMNGKIDLLFYHRGQYFILDWKSNHLGTAPEDYQASALQDTMHRQNYRLQYLIYTVAAKKYLESRLGKKFLYERDFGGVLYFFIRGMRAGSPHGVFFDNPSIQSITELTAILEGEAPSFRTG